MTLFYFVRHGQLDRSAGDQDPPLTPLGRDQAQAAALYLSTRPIARVYVSPLHRAQETAAAIAAPHGLAVATDAHLRERANWGDLPGQSWADFVAMWERCNRERSYRPPAGDSAEGAGHRIERFVQAVHAELSTVLDGLHAGTGCKPSKEVVAVSHGGIIADFLLNVFPLAVLEQVNPAFAADPYSAQVMVECSITDVRCEGQSYTAEAIAYAGYLP